MILEKYGKIIRDSYTGYWDYLINEISTPHWGNYFYWLTGLSILVYLLEIIKPWRKDQKLIRKDFFLDMFYMYFNYFLFSLIVFSAMGNVFVELFNSFIGLFGLTNIVAIHLDSWPTWLQLLTLFVIADFIQWNIHRLLHRVPFLWEFHKVHHSIKEMGFAAQLRYHWVENLVYKSIQYIPLGMIGFGIDDFFIVYMFQTAIGHWNHANFTMNIGPLKYIFNNPEMHIWHHAKELPPKHSYGANFGLTLSVWDYIFGSAYIPRSGRDIELGFGNDENFPESFPGQVIYGFGKRQGGGQLQEESENEEANS